MTSCPSMASIPTMKEALKEINLCLIDDYEPKLKYNSCSPCNTWADEMNILNYKFHKLYVDLKLVNVDDSDITCSYLNWFNRRNQDIFTMSLSCYIPSISLTPHLIKDLPKKDSTLIVNVLKMHQKKLIDYMCELNFKTPPRRIYNKIEFEEARIARFITEQILIDTLSIPDYSHQFLVKSKNYEQRCLLKETINSDMEVFIKPLVVAQKEYKRFLGEYGSISLHLRFRDNSEAQNIFSKSKSGEYTDELYEHIISNPYDPNFAEKYFENLNHYFPKRHPSHDYFCNF